MDKVSIIRCNSYESEGVRLALKKCISFLGGIENYIPRGSKVLLKTNALSPSRRETRVCTDPEIIRAMCEVSLESGASRVSIGDSPGFGNVKGVYKKCGLLDAIEGIDASIVEFDDFVEVKGATFPKIEIAKAALEADVVINLAKAKTHGQMGLTLAVKNMFGCVPGLRKSQWHLRAGTDQKMFARLLIDIALITKPKLNIIDAVIGMEGNGPSMGKTRNFNFIGASDSPFALDVVVAEILGYKLKEFPTYIAAREMGVGPEKLSDIELVGDSIDDFKIRNLKLAVGKSLRMLPPSVFHTFREWATSRPVINPNKCIRCGNCVKICAAKAISLKKIIEMDESEKIKKSELRKSSPPEIDRSKCIRCFCCQEICPVGAITIREGFISRIAIR